MPHAEPRLPWPIDSGGAFIDGKFRYHLWRAWQLGGRSVAWIMLNPSTADATTEDPTIRRCIGFTQAWGFGSIDVLNLYAYRATDPGELRKAGFPVGQYTEAIMRSVLSEYVDLVVVAWGTLARQERASEVLQIVRDAGFEPHALQTTKAGHPAHPLYLPSTCQPIPYHEPEEIA